TCPPPRDRLAVRLGTLGLHPAGGQPARVRLLGLGDGALGGCGRGDARSWLRCPPRRGSHGSEWMSTKPPDRARVVVLGGGVIGTSVGYPLKKLRCEHGRPLDE